MEPSYSNCVQVVVKKECDSDGSETARDLNMGHMQLRQDPGTDMSVDMIQRDIKKEDRIYEVMIKEELDIGPSVLQPRPSPHPYWLPFETHEPASHPTANSRDNAMLEPLDITAVQSVPKAKEEDHFSKGDCKESTLFNSSFILDVNTTDSVTKGMWKKSTKCTGTQREVQDTHCVKPLTECDFTINTTNTKRDTHNDKNKCEYCGHNTNSKDKIEKHMCLHKPKNPPASQQNEYSQSDIGRCATVKPYKCNQCEYSASYLYILQRHMRTHTGEKPYKCKHCDYSASQIGTLHAHMRRHTGEKPYKCMYCEYSASRLSSVQTHMRRHTGEKPYRCEHCEYKASDRNHLQRHMRRHTGEKPYMCLQCEYSTSDVGNLKRHMRMHTNKKLCKSKQCEYRPTQ